MRELFALDFAFRVGFRVLGFRIQGLRELFAPKSQATPYCFLSPFQQGSDNVHVCMYACKHAYKYVYV